jgi:hypothetical protein
LNEYVQWVDVSERKEEEEEEERYQRSGQTRNINESLTLEQVKYM